MQAKTKYCIKQNFGSNYFHTQSKIATGERTGGRDKGKIETQHTPDESRIAGIFEKKKRCSAFD